MSTILLSKLDVDVLVQLALVGPDGARGWRPLTDSPDRLGRLLWRRNYEVAGDPAVDPVPADYVFARLPIALTAAEGVKQCRFYRYQTADGSGRWARGGLGDFLDRLESTLVDALPGVAEAPWGWSGRELAERSDRRPPSGAVADEPEDPRITAWFQQWAQAGVRLTRTPPANPQYAPVPDPRDVLASGYYRPRGQCGFAPVVATLLANEAVAATYFADHVRQHQGSRDHDSHVYRWGTSVAATRFLLAYEEEFIPEVDGKMASIGDPDEHWWSLAPPLRELAAEVMATRVRTDPTAAGTHADARAVFGRTPTELNAVIAMVADPGLRDRLAAVNTRKQTVVLLRGVVDLAAVTHAWIEQELLDHGYGPRLEHVLRLGTEGATMATATLVVIDRLAQTPAKAVIDDPALRVGMIGDRPPRQP